MKNKKKTPKLTKTYDLATEAHRLLRGDSDVEIDGVEEIIDQNKLGKISTIKITTKDGAEAMGKPMGNYITADFPHLLEEDDLTMASGEALSHLLHNVLPPFHSQKPILLVGLGNPHTAADALGVKVAEKALITRHLLQNTTKEEQQGFRSVAALIPNVTHNTGIEAAELICGLVKEIAPSCVIVVDALAAASISRVATSIQITDTGITPGSGVGNHRLTLNEKTLGVPVLAIGIPMVVYTETIIREILGQYNNETELSPDLTSVINNFAVTPKDIEYLTEKVARVITIALHLAIHPALNRENIAEYLPL